MRRIPDHRTWTITAASAGEPIPIDRVDASAFRVPTERPQSDGTFEWDATTVVIAEVHAADASGIGYAYTDASAAVVIRDVLAPAVRAIDAMSTTRAWDAMRSAVRNMGSRGIAASAIAAVDAALWDLKGRLLDLPLLTLLGAVRETVPAYGSGGFTSESLDELRDEMEMWLDAGLRRVKMKVGREPARDRKRVREVRRVIGDEVELFVDANGAWTASRALAHAEEFAEYDVRWFEEPVSSDDLQGLRRVRDRAPAGMEIAAGEYGWDLPYFRRMLDAGAVDVLQADATRCAGISGLVRVSALCEAYGVPLSAHTAPALHAHPACALTPMRHVEYFRDHVRLESMLFDGVPALAEGELRPDTSRPGLGLELRRADAERWMV